MSRLGAAVVGDARLNRITRKQLAYLKRAEREEVLRINPGERWYVPMLLCRKGMLTLQTPHVPGGYAFILSDAGRRAISC